MCLTWSEAVTGLAKPQRDDPSLAQQGSMCSLLQITLSLLLCAPLSCFRRILLCVILCRAFVKHSEPLPLVFSFVFSLPLSFTVPLPVFLVTIFLLFFFLPLKCTSAQWIFALLYQLFSLCFLSFHFPVNQLLFIPSDIHAYIHIFVHVPGTTHWPAGRSEMHC